MTNSLKLTIILTITFIAIGFTSVKVYTTVVTEQLETIDSVNCPKKAGEVEAVTSNLLQLGDWVLGCSLLLFLIVAVVIYRHYTHHMRFICTYAENLATGNYKYTPPNKTIKGELGQLLRSLDHVRDRLQSTTQKLAKSYEREEQALREVEDANGKRNQFLANISRGLKDPLNSILGFSALIMKEINNGSYDYKLKEKTNIILKSARYLDSLIGNLIELSRIDAEDISLNVTEFETSEFMSELIQYNINEAEQKNISLGTHFTSELPPVLTSDRKVLFHILSNLILNATKASPFGTEVAFGVESDDEHFVFYIKDSVVEEDAVPLAKLYEKYVKSETEPFVGIKGMYVLNMTIVKAHASLLNAKIETELDSSGSSIFRVVFNLEDIVCSDYSDDMTARFFIQDKKDGVIESNNQLDTHKVIDIEFNLDKPISVLMAENNESNRMFVEAVLDGANCELEYVDDGMTCLDVLNRRDFDVLLLDNHINKLDAIKVVEALRSNARFESLPIILMAAYISDDDRNNMLLAGVNDCILKPIDADELTYLVRSWYMKTR